MAHPRTYAIRLTQPAEKQLKLLARKLGKALFAQVRAAIEDLATDPRGKTQELGGKLAPYRSLHVNRVRVIVRIAESVVTVYVVAAGWHSSGERDDVYQEFKRMLERRGDAIGE